MESANDGTHVRSYVNGSIEFDVRLKVNTQNKSASYFAVFPNHDISTFGKETVEEAASAGTEVAKALA